MGLFDILSNSVTGAVQAAVNVVKLAPAVIISPLDDGKAVIEAGDGIAEGVSKIGRDEPDPDCRTATPRAAPRTP